MKTRAIMLCLTGSLLGGSAIGPALGQDARPAVPVTVEYNPIVFQLSDLPAQYTKSFKPDVVDYAAVSPDLIALDALELEMPFTIDLLNGETLEGSLTARTRSDRERYTAHGVLAGHPDGQFALARLGAHLAMSIRIPSEGLFYMVRSIGGGQHVMLRIEDGEREQCAAGVQSPHDEHDGHDGVAHEAQDTPGATPPPDPGFDLRGTCVAPDPTWDMVVCYTPSARAAAAIADGAASVDPGPIESLILLYTEEANTTFENSEIDARLRVVHMAEVSYPNNVPIGDVLDDMRTGSGGLNVVQNLRNAYLADTAMLMTDTGSGGCGIAYCCASSSTAYGVSEWACWGATFVHEFGHNLGCAHNPEDVDCGGCDSDARGHYFTGNDSVEYGTIMSYIGANFWHFSNPNLTYQGQPVGIASERNNVATINGRRFTVNNLRTSGFEAWMDPSETFPGSGSFDSPFIAIATAQSYLLESDSASEPPTMYIKSGTTSETPTLNKPMTVRACGGTVTIGQL